MADGGRWLGLQPGVRRISGAVPSSLYRHSQRSCQPQPREGGGDATSRKDTRQDRWLYFGFQLRWSLFLCLVRVLRTTLERAQNVESQGRLAADTTKSSGSLHSLQTTPSHRTTCQESPRSLWADIGAACPQSWEFSGDVLIHLRGNPRNSVNGIKGQRPKNRTSIVITSWKNQEFSDTTRDGKILCSGISSILHFLAVRF